MKNDAPTEKTTAIVPIQLIVKSLEVALMMSGLFVFLCFTYSWSYGVALFQMLGLPATMLPFSSGFQNWPLNAVFTVSLMSVAFIGSFAFVAVRSDWLRVCAFVIVIMGAFFTFALPAQWAIFLLLATAFSAGSIIGESTREETPLPIFVISAATLFLTVLALLSFSYSEARSDLHSHLSPPQSSRLALARKFREIELPSDFVPSELQGAKRMLFICETPTRIVVAYPNQGRLRGAAITPDSIEVLQFR